MNKWPLLLLLGTLTILPTFSEDKTPDNGNEERLNTIKYGLDTEVVELLGKLRSEKNNQFDESLAQLLKDTKNLKLKEELVRYFFEFKNPLVENTTLDILNKDTVYPNSLVLACISYLAEIKSESAKDSLVKIMEGQNKTLAVAAIRAAGKMQITAVGESLQRKLTDPEFDEAMKTDLIWSLGELKYEPAFETLVEAESDSKGQPLNRSILIEAIGKFNNDKALQILLTAALDDNLQIKQKALTGLKNFPLNEEIKTTVSSVMKDSQPAIRIAALDLVGFFQISELVPLIDYRFKKDPDPKVRSIALNTTLKLDEGKGKKLIEDVLSQKDQPFVLTIACIDAIFEKKYSEFTVKLLTVMEKELNDRIRPVTKYVSTKLGLKNLDLDPALFYFYLKDKDQGLRQTATNAIISKKMVSVLPHLDEMEKNKEITPKAASDLKEKLKSIPAE